MKRLLFVFFALTLLLSACAPAAALAPTAAPTTQSISLKDGLGRTVSIPAVAKKVISLAASNTEMLYALGAGGLLVGRDDFSDYPVEVSSVAKIGGNMGKYNYEQIAKLQPDLVLAASLNTPEQIKALEDLKINVVVLTNPTTFEGLYANLETIGKLTGKETEAKNLNASLQKRIKAVDDGIAKTQARPKVFYELDASEPAKPYTAGANTFIDLLIKKAGGENVGAKLKGDYPQISQEELVVQNPDIILLGDAAYGISAEQVGQRAGWGGLKAVKDKQIFAVDDNQISRPGPRLVDGLESLAKQIHPEAFK